MDFASAAKSSKRHKKFHKDSSLLNNFPAITYTGCHGSEEEKYPGQIQGEGISIWNILFQNYHVIKKFRFWVRSTQNPRRLEDIR